MIWPKSNKDTEREAAVQNALRASEHGREQIELFRPYVEDAVRRHRKLQEENHFAPRLRKAFGL